MQKVVLINPPQYTKYPQPPMGLALLGAILEREGYEVSIIDANVLRLEDVAHLVVKADVVGITAMTPTINTALGIAHYLKRDYPDLIIILGGVHSTLLPQETFIITSDIDIIVRGEGDETLPEALKVLREQNPAKPIGSVRGIYFEEGENVLHSGTRQDVDMDSLPYLAYHLLPWQEYKPHPPHGRALPFIAMITSRGCPYHCSFCSKAVFGNKFRSQSPMRVVDEVEYYIKRFGAKEIAFYDDVFTLDTKRVYGITDEILKRGLKVSWTCETRANLVDRELLKCMKKAGCYSIAYGVESASQDILDIIDKDITLEQVREGVRLTREVGIQTIGYFMVGSPNETLETIRQTIDFAKELKLDYAQFSITTPFPKTKLYEYYMDSNEEDVPWDNFVYAGTGNQVAPVFDGGALNREEIKYWASRAYKEFYLRPSYIWQRLSRIRSIGDVKVLAKGMAMLLGNVRK